MILDGYGLNPSETGNAVKAADTPVLDRIFAEYPNILFASLCNSVKS